MLVGSGCPEGFRSLSTGSLGKTPASEAAERPRRDGGSVGSSGFAPQAPAAPGGWGPCVYRGRERILRERFLGRKQNKKLKRRDLGASHNGRFHRREKRKGKRGEGSSGEKQLPTEEVPPQPILVLPLSPRRGSGIYSSNRSAETTVGERGAVGRRFIFDLAKHL